MDYLLIYLIGAIVSYLFGCFVLGLEGGEYDIISLALYALFITLFWPVMVPLCFVDLGRHIRSFFEELEGLNDNSKRLTDSIIDSVRLRTRVDSLEDRVNVFDEENEIMKDLREGV
jgi:hypothetical protein